MRDFPSGTVTFLFTDVEGSTRRWEQDSAATGIISSTGQTTVGNPILALFDNALAGATEFPLGSGQSIPFTAVVWKYTYFGDSDLNGMVTPDDYGALDANLGATVALGESWFKGDFNFDGEVTPDDYGAIDSNLGNGETQALSASGLAALGTVAVPEPGVVGVLGVGVLMARRKRARR